MRRTQADRQAEAARYKQMTEQAQQLVQDGPYEIDVEQQDGEDEE